jgi:nucleoporin POM34
MAAQLTPTKVASPAQITDSPGNWKHPRLAEITRRQRKTEFSQRNLNSIAYNAGALIVSVVVRQIATSKLPSSWFVSRPYLPSIC